MKTYRDRPPQDPAVMLAQTIIISCILVMMLWVFIVWIALWGNSACAPGDNVCVDLITQINKSSEK